MRRQQFAVVDVETTGLYNSDRVVEVGVVIVDEGGALVDEYETLVDPERDVGPTDLHGISASMVSAAPRFAEIAETVADLLHERTLVAHNVPFDSRFLANEFERVGLNFDGGEHVCTLALTGSRLNLACEEFGIGLTEHHRAIADARATAALLSHTSSRCSPRGVAIDGYPPRSAGRTACRPGQGTSAKSDLLRVMDRVRYPAERAAILTYLDALDWALNDYMIDAVERDALVEIAATLGISPNEVDRAHDRYLDLLIDAVERDGIVTKDEEAMLRAVSDALGLKADLPAATAAPDASTSLAPGGLVCFTGTATLPRSELERLAESIGLVPHSGVTKQTVAVVAADPASSSGKAKKARAYGIPVLSEAAFLDVVAAPSG